MSVPTPEASCRRASDSNGSMEKHGPPRCERGGRCTVDDNPRGGFGKLLTCPAARPISPPQQEQRDQGECDYRRLGDAHDPPLERAAGREAVADDRRAVG